MKKLPNSIILLKAIVGSQAYGTNTPESDVDTKGIYLQDPFDVSSFGYVPQVEIDKDNCLFEVKRFLELVQLSNPTMLELLFTPEDCIIEKHPLFDVILKHKQSFITKECMNSFMGYAKQQIYKAKGLNKKMNWEKDRVERKRPIDFMKIIDHHTGESCSFVNWLQKQNYPETSIGLTKVNNTEQLYCVYYNDGLDEYKGVCNNDMLLLSEIPYEKRHHGIALATYNLNGFQEHCKDYNSYQTWLRERNTARYVDIENHGQQIDGKNMLHCYRLLQMAREIAKDGEFNVRRANAKDLLKIRKGEVSLQELLDGADAIVKETEELFRNSHIPDKIDRDLVNVILKEIRIKSLGYEFSE